MYKFYNANSKGKFVNDCSIRAISLAECKTWDETYRELSDIARRKAIILDDVKFIDPLLDSRYKRYYCDDMFVGDFVDNHPIGTYLITMNNHITCCIDGCIYDTFDCRDRRIKCIWEVK